jgi:hypothetical protein
MKLSVQEILIILMVIGFTIGFAYRAGIVRGRGRRTKEK